MPGGPGLSGAALNGGEVDTETARMWLDEGRAPSGANGRVFTENSVHGFDLTFAAPKSVSLLRALTDDLGEKIMVAAHLRAVQAAMGYLHRHAGYTRVHNPVTGVKDLQCLPGLVAIAYQHETSRCGDPHLHTHVIVPNRQPRDDGQLVSLDSKSLYHEAKAAGMIYQATLCHKLHAERGLEFAPIDAGIDSGVVAPLHPATGMGPRQPRAGRRPTQRRAVGRRAKGHPPRQTRIPGLGVTQGAVARRCAQRRSVRAR